jgi:hypothetical protein
MATTYKLESRILGSGTWTPGPDNMTLADGEVRQTLTGLTIESDYEFRIVRATSGVLSVSNTVVARTKAPEALSDNGEITGFGTFTFGGSTSNTITRTTTSTIIQFTNNSWRAVGIEFNPGAGPLKYYLPNNNVVMDGYILDSSNLYLQKSGNRAVVVKLPASVTFKLEISTGPSSKLDFTISSV